jgi:hypothetical protein
MEGDHRRLVDRTPADQITEMAIRIARLEEKVLSSEKSLDISRAALIDWQHASNEWRKLVVDQQDRFITMDKLLAVIGAMVAVILLIFKFIR